MRVRPVVLSWGQMGMVRMKQSCKQDRDHSELMTTAIGSRQWSSHASISFLTLPQGNLHDLLLIHVSDVCPVPPRSPSPAVSLAGVIQACLSQYQGQGAGPLEDTRHGVRNVIQQSQQDRTGQSVFAFSFSSSCVSEVKIITRFDSNRKLIGFTF